MTIKRILLPTDFSVPSHRAVDHAVEMAQRYEARLWLLHVRTLFADDPQNLEYRYLDEGRYQEFLEQSLDSTAASIKGPPEFETAITRNISPAAGILEFCEENQVDLVVMGTHGRSALGHFFLGSVAEKVVRHASCPVLTVGPGREGYADDPAYKRILVPYDFSDHSNQAAIQSRDVARHFEAEVHVLYVLEQEVHPAFFAAWRESIEHRIDEISDNVVQALGEAISPAQASEMKIHVQIGDRRADREISTYAHENQIDLIVMGTHGLSGLDRALLGSTTERVVRIAPCPVMTSKLRTKGSGE